MWRLARPREASWIAASAMPTPITSVSMCPRVGEEREGVGEKAADDLDDEVPERESERGDEAAAVALARPASVARMVVAVAAAVIAAHGPG